MRLLLNILFFRRGIGRPLGTPTSDPGGGDDYVPTYHYLGF